MNRICKPGQVNHSERTWSASDSDFLHTLANRRHRFEVIGLFASLHFFHLVAGIVARRPRKFPQAIQRIPEKSDRLHGRIILVWI